MLYSMPPERFLTETPQLVSASHCFGLALCLSPCRLCGALRLALRFLLFAGGGFALLVVDTGEVDGSIWAWMECSQH